MSRCVPFGIYLRALLHGPVRVLRLQHLHRHRAGPRRRGEGASVATYADAAIAELDLAVRSVGDDRRVSTVFVGGGTPTLLPPQDLVRFLDAVRERWGLADDVEVTTEANPDSVTEESLRVLADGASPG